MQQIAQLLMQKLVRRVVGVALGIAVTMTYWYFMGGGAGTSVEGIPAKVWGGGAGLLSVEVASTTAARFSISFSDNEDRELDAWTLINPGTQSWVIDIPHGAGG
jgi:hypothetical protein